jgi:hypothetical protein
MRRLAYFFLVLLLAGAVWYGVMHRRSPSADKVPTTMEEFKRRPGGKLTVEAGEFLLGLAKEGKLPGFSAGEHGTMHAGILDAKANPPSGAVPEPDPVSRVIHFQKQGNAADYFYVVVLESDGVPWKLQRAWRTNADGHVVETYPVP